MKNCDSAKGKRGNKQFCKFYGSELRNETRLLKGSTVIAKSARMQAVRKKTSSFPSSNKVSA